VWQLKHSSLFIESVNYVPKSFIALAAAEKVNSKLSVQKLQFFILELSNLSFV
jgi:hypothetical protein